MSAQDGGPAITHVELRQMAPSRVMAFTAGQWQDETERYLRELTRAELLRDYVVRAAKCGGHAGWLAREALRAEEKALRAIDAARNAPESAGEPRSGDIGSGAVSEG